MQAEGAMIRLRTGSGPEAGPTQAQNIIYFFGRVPRPPGPPRTQTRRSPAGPKTVYKKARCDLQRKTPRRAATAAGTTLPQGGKPLRRVGGGEPFGMVSLAGGAAQTPKIDGSRPARNRNVRPQRTLHRRGTKVYGADSWRSRRCKTSPVDLERFWDHLWQKNCRKSTSLHVVRHTVQGTSFSLRGTPLPRLSPQRPASKCQIAGDLRRPTAADERNAQCHESMCSLNTTTASSPTASFTLEAQA